MLKTPLVENILFTVWDKETIGMRVCVRMQLKAISYGFLGEIQLRKYKQLEFWHLIILLDFTLFATLMFP